MRSLFGGRRRRPMSHGRELHKYRRELLEHTTNVDTLLGEVADTIDALRRRALDPDDAVSRLSEREDALDVESEALREMMAPEELHGLHMEYEANLHRTLRGIVTVQRGCAITRMRHRPPDDEEPQIYYKRGHANVIHARLRMNEVVEVLVNWEPGRPAEATLATRLNRE